MRTENSGESVTSLAAEIERLAEMLDDLRDRLIAADVDSGVIASMLQSATFAWDTANDLDPE